MARKVVSRRALREEADAAEAAEKSSAATKKKGHEKEGCQKDDQEKGRQEEDDHHPQPRGQGGPPQALWGVFNQSMRRVAVFEYNEKRKADKMAAELTEKAKAPHFVQCVKEAIEE